MERSKYINQIKNVRKTVSLLVAYRLQRTKETLAEADNLIEDNYFNAVLL